MNTEFFKCIYKMLYFKNVFLEYPRKIHCKLIFCRSLQSLTTTGNILSPKLSGIPSRTDSFSVQPQFPSSFHQTRRSNELLSSQLVGQDSVFEDNRLSGTASGGLIQDDNHLVAGASQRNRTSFPSARRFLSDMEGSPNPEQSAPSTDNSPMPALNLYQKYKKK